MMAILHAVTPILATISHQLFLKNVASMRVNKHNRPFPICQVDADFEHQLAADIDELRAVSRAKAGFLTVG